MQKLHVSLMAGQANASWLKIHSFPIDEYTARPLAVEDHLAIEPDVPGTDVVFKLTLGLPSAVGGAIFAFDRVELTRREVTQCPIINTARHLWSVW